MRWFKHMTLSHSDEILSELMDEFGAEGYGVWWLILEKIASLLDQNQQTFARYSVKVWSNFVRVSPRKLQNIARFLEKNELIFSKLEGDYLTISCPNLLKYKDEYTKKSLKQKSKCPDKLPTNSGQTPEQETETETETETEDIKSCSSSLGSATSPSAQDSSNESTKTKTENSKNYDSSLNETTDSPVDLISHPRPYHSDIAEDAATDKNGAFMQQYFDVLVPKFSTLGFSGIKKKTSAMFRAWIAEGVECGDVEQAMRFCEERGDRVFDPSYYAQIAIDFSRERKRYGQYQPRASPSLGGAELGKQVDEILKKRVEWYARESG